MDLLSQKILAATIVDTSPLPPPTLGSNAELQTILNIVFSVTGAIALLVITLAGFRYTISHGDPNIIAQSKQAIIYALIGLVVSIAAVAIVNFVVVRT